jgi:hypothetical protein
VESISIGNGNVHVSIFLSSVFVLKNFLLDISAEINEESLRTTSLYEKIVKKLDIYKAFKKEKPVPQIKGDKSAYKAFH